jgi:hypothetical protein
VRNSEIGTSLLASGLITPDRLTEYREIEADSLDRLLIRLFDHVQ